MLRVPAPVLGKGTRMLRSLLLGHRQRKSLSLLRTYQMLCSALQRRTWLPAIHCLPSRFNSQASRAPPSLPCPTPSPQLHPAISLSSHLLSNSPLPCPARQSAGPHLRGDLSQYLNDLRSGSNVDVCINSASHTKMLRIVGKPKEHVQKEDPTRTGSSMVRSSGSARISRETHVLVIEKDGRSGDVGWSDAAGSTVDIPSSIDSDLCSALNRHKEYVFRLHMNAIFARFMAS